MGWGWVGLGCGEERAGFLIIIIIIIIIIIVSNTLVSWFGRGGRRGRHQSSRGSGWFVVVALGGPGERSNPIWAKRVSK